MESATSIATVRKKKSCPTHSTNKYLYLICNFFKLLLLLFTNNSKGQVHVHAMRGWERVHIRFNIF